jgi:hypothetical protein
LTLKSELADAVKPSSRQESSPVNPESGLAHALSLNASEHGALDVLTMTKVALLGVDVGFSKTRETTGIACLDDDRLILARAGTPWEFRKAKLPCGFKPSVLAIDGPLLPQGSDALTRRQCEFIFVHKPFHNRCKPGLSHWGIGLKLREAAMEASSRSQFGSLLAQSTTSQSAFVARTGPNVEAFPNAFLGVLASDSDLLAAPRLPRGRRFDWLYDRVTATGKLEAKLSPILGLPSFVWRKAESLTSKEHHEERAALICLLTAALAAQNRATVIGDETGGWFWLPPRALWEQWAIRGLNDVVRAMALKGVHVHIYEGVGPSRPQSDGGSC